MNPYILQGQPMQDVGGLSPVFQNFGQQQANQQAALAQQNQLAQQAGQSQSSGLNPMALAQALRKDPNNPDAPSMLQNAKAYINSKFGRDPLQPDTGEAAKSAQEFYGNTYNSDAGWSS
jgi:hypothetical protein